jgi:hypothetical protein
MAMRIARQVAWQVIDGEAMIVDLDSGKTLGLNETATWIWSHLDGRTAIDLAADLAAEFAISPVDAERDVNEFLSVLRERKLIAES